MASERNLVLILSLLALRSCWLAELPVVSGGMLQPYAEDEARQNEIDESPRNVSNIGKQESEALKAPLINMDWWTWLTNVVRLPIVSVFAYRTEPRNCPICSCGKRNNDSRIVGGTNAQEDRYPWMVALYYNNRFICGGSLINDRYVLTAAHCVYNTDRSLFSVKFLLYDRGRPAPESFERRVSYIMTNWFVNAVVFIMNDLALLKLNETVPINDQLYPVCMPVEGETYAGFDGIITGWGKLGNFSFPRKLQEVAVPILSSEECMSQSEYFKFQINDRILCAGVPEGGKDSCQGDSGGPMHIIDPSTEKYILAGVVSYGFGCARPKYPGIYARVNRFLSWINFNTRDACWCICGVNGRSNRIVGGEETNAHEYPWLAGLFRQGKLYCGASVLTKNYLITAAHCVNSFEPNEIRIYLGGHNIAKDYTELRRVKRIVDHEDFDIFTFNNDIALLELDKPLRYGPTIQPACLPDGGEHDFTGSLGIVAGWGRIEERLPPSKTLRSVMVPIWSQQQCLEAGYGSKKISENMMCAGYHDGKKDACQGDSGGPMHKMGNAGSMEVIGVVSWGRGCARPNLPVTQDGGVATGGKKNPFARRSGSERSPQRSPGEGEGEVRGGSEEVPVEVKMDGPTLTRVINSVMTNHEERGGQTMEVITDVSDVIMSFLDNRVNYSKDLKLAVQALCALVVEAKSEWRTLLEASKSAEREIRKFTERNARRRRTKRRLNRRKTVGGVPDRETTQEDGRDRGNSEAHLVQRTHCLTSFETSSSGICTSQPDMLHEYFSVNNKNGYQPNGIEDTHYDAQNFSLSWTSTIINERKKIVQKMSTKMKFKSTAVIVTVVGMLLLAVMARRCRAATGWYGNQTDVDYRGGRFLFDALFGLDTGGFSLVDEDVSDGTNLVRGCDCECGTANQETRIVGGRPTGVNQYPWLARLVYDGQFHCGASLLTKDYVLTAAHCVRRLKRNKIRVILGDHDQFLTTETEAIQRAVTAIIRHRSFDQNSYNHDIALLKLRKPVDFNKTIKPVCLPKDRSEPAGSTGTVVGWGRTSEGGTLPGIVQHVDVPILTLDQCRSMKYRASRITSNMLCAGKGKQDSCQGDSGGPLLVRHGDKHEIVGIVSWGVGCGRAGYPGVYTRVARYLPWIRANMDDTCLCTNGQLEDLCVFRDSFQSAVGSPNDIGSVEKLHCLKGPVESEAARILDPIKVCEQGYNDALNLRSENKRQLIKCHIKTLFDTPAMRTESAEDLIALVDRYLQQISVLKSLGEPADKWSSLLVCTLQGVEKSLYTRLDPDNIVSVLGAIASTSSTATDDSTSMPSWKTYSIQKGGLHPSDTARNISLNIPCEILMVAMLLSCRNVKSCCQALGTTGTILRGVSAPWNGSLGHMRVFDPNERYTRPRYYLPHHAVIKMDSTATKLRTVFDASCPSKSALSLNDVLLAGPTIQDTLVTIVTRFRIFELIASADIEKILLKRLTDNAEQQFTLTAPVLRRDFYVDYLLSSSNDAGHLVLDAIPPEHLQSSTLSIKPIAVAITMKRSTSCCGCFFRVVGVFLVVGMLTVDAKLAAHGKYQMMATPNKNTDERSLMDSVKLVFGRGSNKPPAHDTPSSACSCRCGERNDASRIVGGQPTGINEFPWMARLSYFNRFYCGGMLINDRYVLTAAHCVKGFMWFMIKVTFGEHNRCDDAVRPETRFVLRAIAQKFSFLNFDNDIALLRLNDRVPITDFIRPICLPTDPVKTYVGMNGLVTGWGTLKEDGKPSCILQEVEVPVLSNDVCSSETNYTASMITDNMMCAGYLGKGKKDSCQGDSGGPLIAERPDKRYELIGVVSWGNGCARPYYPGVYTRVTQYLDWIKENSNDGCFCSE
ncbi:uncharacterized protein LOC134206439 [Armigeres subalbatus]|uniref:uncharacterized protein LOC134206439 n=1 Tax=Armigeres subalbatus TaxID=124917 RepID=UPI002ED05FB0